MCGRRGDCKQLFGPNEKAKKRGKTGWKRGPKASRSHLLLLFLLLMLLTLFTARGSKSKSMSKREGGG
jgi:hypothetical protein